MAKATAQTETEDTPEPKPAPEVRQCQDSEHWLFGCVAVKAAIPGMAWGIFNPATGGHWEQSDDVVEGWKVLT